MRSLAQLERRAGARDPWATVFARAAEHFGGPFDPSPRPTSPGLLGIWQRNVQIPLALRECMVNGGDPREVLASAPWPMPSDCEERLANLREAYAMWREPPADDRKPSARSRQEPPFVSGLPDIFRGATLNDFRQQPDRTVTGLSELLAIRKPASVLVLGPNGSGKSHLSAILARRWGGLWVAASAITRASLFDPHGGVVSEATDATVLFLDDLSGARTTGSALEALFSVVQERDDFMRPTVVTSHQTLTELERIDSGLASRLGGFHRIVIKGPDRRIRR